MKKTKLLILLLFMVLLIVPVAVHAYAVEHGSSVYVAKDRTVDGNLFAAGADVTVDGHVTGDVFCAGQSISINGTVDGDVICAGQAISVNGKVGGSVRAAGSNVEIRGQVARGLTVAGANVNLAEGANVGWDALVAAANVNLRGDIGRSLLGAGANYVLGGKISKDTSLYLGGNKAKNMTELTVLDTAAIGGGLNYMSQADATISPKAQVKGKVTHNLPPVREHRQSNSSGVFGVFLIALLSALIAGYVLIGFWKKPMLSIADSMASKFWPMVGWGALTMIVAPIIAILLAITIVGFRLTLLMAFSWLVILMLSKIFAAIAVGKWLLGKAWTSQKDSAGWIVAVGIVLSWIVFYIPFIGWLASLIAMWWGAGAILMHLKKSHDASKL